jgi:cap2 methyltransferase
VAAGKNSGRLVAMLILLGAERSTKDINGRTALTYAKETGSDEAARELERGGVITGRCRRIEEVYEESAIAGRSFDGWKDPAENPHARQVLLSTGYASKCDLPFSRILEDDMPRLPYRRRKGEEKTVIHWGQRKVLMSEIEFLSLFGAPGKMVVYAGAAPGTHIAFLSYMFPELHFYCVDPAPFTVKATEKITIVQDLFSDEMAQRLGKDHPGLLFISDIRSADWERDNDQVIEQKVGHDMAKQQDWHMLMKPMRSMLKFRLPWAAGSTSYLDGDVYLPVWGPFTTTETRLISKENSTALIEYDHKKYEQQLFYFNTVARPALYEHDVQGEGIDHCYDCRAEIHILSSYLEKFRAVPKDQIAHEVQLMSKAISKQIAHGRTLKDPNPDPGDRKKRIPKNQSIIGMSAYEKYDCVGVGARGSD